MASLWENNVTELKQLQGIHTIKELPCPMASTPDQHTESLGEACLGDWGTSSLGKKDIPHVLNKNILTGLTKPTSTPDINTLYQKQGKFHCGGSSSERGAIYDIC